MDQHADLSQNGSSVGTVDGIRSLGFRRVAPINTRTLSWEELEAWWQLVASQDYMFSDWERGNREGWLTRFLDMKHLHLNIGGDGYAVLLNAWVCDTPELHFCIWNPVRPFSETLEAGREIFNFVFNAMHAVRITGFIPDNNKLAIKFATLMGFKFEGLLRKAYRYNDQALDIHCYGLLDYEWRQREERLSHGRHSE